MPPAPQQPDDLVAAKASARRERHGTGRIVRAGDAVYSRAGGPMDTAETLAAQYLSQNRSIDIGSCVRRGIDLVTGNLGLVVGACVLAFVVMFGIALVPILGWIAAFVVDPVIIAGLYLLLLKRIRGQHATIGDVFSGFGGSVMNLALAGIVSGILVSIGFFFLVLPGIYLVVGYVFALALVADKKLEFWTAMELSRRVV